MMDDLMERSPLQRGVMMALMTATGLVVGLSCGFAVGRLLKAAKVQSLPWSDEGALMIAMTCLATGAAVAVLSTLQWGRAILASPSAPDFSRRVRPSQTLFFILQAGVLILAGGLLAAPVAHEVLTRGAPGSGGPLLMAAIVAGFGLQTILNVVIWLRADEVFRGVIAQSGAASFWILQGLFFLWAAGEKLQVLPRISSWDAVTVMMGVYLIASTIMTYRRGLG